MDQEEQNKLTERIEKVEALLIDLGNQVSDINDQLNRQRINQGQPADYAPPGNRVEPSPPLSPPPNSNYDKPKSPVEADPDREVNQGEFWLNKIGITLLLIGLGFLFKYSIDQHWVTPFVRVSFGLVLGVVLVGIGMRKFETRKIFSQAVMGGGIAAFYITGYAAFQLYHMVPHFLAFSFMVGVTLLSYYLALYQNEPPLALVAVIGGLGTPFLLNTGSGNIPGLTLYTCVVLAGSMAIYYFRPWVLLYWSSWVGGWIVMGIGLDQLPASRPELIFHSWSVQAGVLFIWILFWMVSIAQKRGQWKPSVAGGLAQPKTTFDCLVQNPNLHITVQMIASALISFQMSKWIWKLSDIQCGSISLAASAIFFLVVFFNWRLKKAHESSALHATVGTLLLTIALFHLLDNHHLFLAYALEATVLHYLAHRTREPAVEIAASSFFTAIGCWYFVRLFGKVEGLPIFNYQALVDVVVMSLAIYASTHINLRSTSKFYILAAYLGFLAWLLRELGVLPDGNSMVSIAWGLTGSTLMWMGLRRKQLDYFKGGFATLVLVAIKLMIIDLAHMEIIWRILIFIGFGTAFLMLSYWMKNMWKLEEPKSPA